MARGEELKKILNKKKLEEKGISQADMDMPTKIAKTAWKPVGAKVLIDIIPIKEKTQGGIIIPDIAQKSKLPKGLVIAVGEKNEDIKVGDIVMYDPQMSRGFLLELEEKGNYLILDPHSIQMIYDRTKESETDNRTSSEEIQSESKDN